MIGAVRPLESLLTLAGYFEYNVMLSWMHNAATGIGGIITTEDTVCEAQPLEGTEDRFKNSVSFVLYVVKSGGCTTCVGSI
ncbi:MAG: hypothetical protein U9Q37_01515 [Euryarchaeota archaeon]|nr:hypothetical protein [Euryarchaeota archaeon]